MTFSNRVTSITQNTILPKVADNYFSDNFATFRFIGNGMKWSGTTLDKPIIIGKNTQGSSFSGLDTLNTGTVDTRVTISYDPRGYSIPIAIPGLEKAVNNISESQIINLVRTETETSGMSALDDTGTMFYADGTGNSSKDFLGLDALADDGTSASTIGGLSRTTYPTLAGTRTASGGTLTLVKISTLMTATSAGSAPKQQTTILVSNETVWDLVEYLAINGVVRANYEANGYPMVTRTSRGVMTQASLRGAHGFVSIVYRGVPVVKDEKSTAQTLWALNENYLQWYGIKSPDLQAIDLGSSTIDGVYTEAPTENTGFQWTGFIKSQNQFGEVAHLMLLGNLVTWQPRRQGRLTGITTA